MLFLANLQVAQYSFHMKVKTFCYVTLFVALFSRGSAGPYAGPHLHGVYHSSNESGSQRPIIGVAMGETHSRLYRSVGDLYVDAAYIKFLQSAGARVVLLRPQMPRQYYLNLLSKLNGVLLPGGSASIDGSEYSRVSRIVYDFTLQANNRGDYFPLWGTCLGFQIQTFLSTGRNLLSRFDSVNFQASLNFSAGYEQSRLFRNASDKIKNALKNENVTVHFHKYGVHHDKWQQVDKLKSFFRMISTCKDRAGQVFVSTIEAVKYPIYGLQWHPEKLLFNWGIRFRIPRTRSARRIAHYFAEFFVNEARKSKHHFTNEKEEAGVMVENYQPRFIGAPSFSVLYVFNRTRMESEPHHTTGSNSSGVWFLCCNVTNLGQSWMYFPALITCLVCISLARWSRLPWLPCNAASARRVYKLFNHKP